MLCCIQIALRVSC